MVNSSYAICLLFKCTLCTFIVLSDKSCKMKSEAKWENMLNANGKSHKIVEREVVVIVMWILKAFGSI